MKFTTNTGKLITKDSDLPNEKIQDTEGNIHNLSELFPALATDFFIYHTPIDTASDNKIYLNTYIKVDLKDENKNLVGSRDLFNSSILSFNILSCYEVENGNTINNVKSKEILARSVEFYIKNNVKSLKTLETFYKNYLVVYTNEGTKFVKQNKQYSTGEFHEKIKDYVKSIKNSFNGLAQLIKKSFDTEKNTNSNSFVNVSVDYNKNFDLKRYLQVLEDLEVLKQTLAERK